MMDFHSDDGTSLSLTSSSSSSSPGVVQTTTTTTATTTRRRTSNDTKKYGRELKEVHFDSESHLSVLFQMYGSVWPKVLPFCIANTCLTGLIYYLMIHSSSSKNNTDLTFSDKGHTYMSLLVSFLVVSRAQIVYGRFMEARSHLSSAMRACREIVHHAVILTLYQVDKNAQEWRYEVSYRTILLLRVLCAAIEHQSSSKNSWEIPEIMPEERIRIRDSLILDPTVAASMEKKEKRKKEKNAGGGASNNDIGDEEEGGKKARSGIGGGSGSESVGVARSCLKYNPFRIIMRYLNTKKSQKNQEEEEDHHPPPLSLPVTPTEAAYRHPSSPASSPVRRLAHGNRSISDENLRVPIILSYQLREAIVSNRKRLTEELHVNEELKILSFVSEFNVAYHGLRKLITTPFPFPLVQMARTFLFFWIFTLPFCLVGDIQKPFQVMTIIFLLTYGFLGLEYVSMELDDPFGDDPNDFDDLTMAQLVFEDIYITINEIDGQYMADKLRFKVRNKEHVGTKFQSFVPGDDFFHDLGMMTGGSKRCLTIDSFTKNVVDDAVYERTPLIAPPLGGGYGARAPGAVHVVGGGGGLVGGGGEGVKGSGGSGAVGGGTVALPRAGHRTPTGSAGGGGCGGGGGGTGSFGRSWFSDHALGIIGGGGAVGGVRNNCGQIVIIPESIKEDASESCDASGNEEEEFHSDAHAVGDDDENASSVGNVNKKIVSSSSTSSGGSMNTEDASSSSSPPIGSGSDHHDTKKKKRERLYFQGVKKATTVADRKESAALP